MFAIVVFYGLFRLVTWPMHHTFQVQLPQGGSVRVQRTPVQYTGPQTPALETKVEAPPGIEPGMTDVELEEWKRKNAESMRILEENERQEAGPEAFQPD